VPVFKAQKSNDLKYKTALTGCLLPEQIHNKISRFKGFDLGTKCKLATECGLAMGNPQWPEF
jgi:hypothetical protein